MVKYIKQKRSFVGRHDLKEACILADILENIEIYNSIIKEFQFSGSTLEGMKNEVEALTTFLIDLCKLLKITKFNTETLDENEKELIKNININKSKIEVNQTKQIELKDKIKVYKHEIKVIKLHISELDGELIQEQKQAKKNNQALRIFLKREKFKFIKKIILSSYRKVFFKYSNELSINNRIVECNKRKEKIRVEKQKFSNIIDKFNRKIIIDKIAIAQVRKCIINMQKQIDIFTLKLQRIETYKQMKNNLRLKIK